MDFTGWFKRGMTVPQPHTGWEDAHWMRLEHLWVPGGGVRRFGLTLWRGKFFLLSHKVEAAGAAMLLVAPEVLPACIPCGSLPKAQGPVSMPGSSLDVMGILNPSGDLGQTIWPWQRSGLGVLVICLSALSRMFGSSPR